MLTFSLLPSFQVSANESDTNMSGYLHVKRKKDWKRMWFVLKGKVLYTYKASEDVAALESMPLLGYEIKVADEVRCVLGLCFK